MLKQRVITAIVLLLILLPAMFYSDPGPFCVISILMISAGAWEWAKLNGYQKSTSLICGFICACLCAAMWRLGALEQSTPQLWKIAGALWVLVGAWVLRGGVAAWSVHRPVIRLLSGLVALSLAWLAVAQAKIIGTNYLLSILVLVWAADIGAYFAGRSLGGRYIHRKLAPGISPGKSWEGVIGGMAGVLVIAFTWRWADLAWMVQPPSLYSQVGLKGEWFLVIAMVFMAVMSVVGDLFESLVKRSAGVKDSSGLLPGHGGVLDRIDALLPALPLAMMLYSF